MKKMILLGWLVLFLPALVSAQEKVEAPVWNVGDKWVFNREGPMEVTGHDAGYYSVQFSGGIFRKEASGIALFERSNLNVKYMLVGNQRKEYKDFRKRILNFPLTLGKEWKDLYQRDEQGAWGGMVAFEYHETFRVLGWEEVAVRAGKFKALKLEYKLEHQWRDSFGWTTGDPSKALYWYSPEARNFIKCQYEERYKEARRQGEGERENWELVSYELKK